MLGPRSSAFFQKVRDELQTQGSSVLQNLSSKNILAVTGQETELIINNVIYFLTLFLPEIQTLMRRSLSPAGIYTTAEQDACFTINVLAKTGIRHIFWKYFVLHRCCYSHRSSLSTPSFNRRETSAICFPLDEWSAMVLPYIMPEWEKASSKTTSKTDFSDNCI